MRQKNAFTLVELVISVLLSAIILVFLMNFIANTFEEVEYSTNKTKIINEIYDFTNKVSDIRQKYNSGTILIDNESGTGSDILLFRTKNNSDGGFIIAQVLKQNLKIDGSGAVDEIGDKVLALRKISSYELTELDSQADKVYDYKFNRDEIFDDIKLKDFQVEKYNSGAIFEANFFVNTLFRENLVGQKYSEIGDSWLEKIVLDF